MTSTVLEAWHKIVRTRDAHGLGALLADDVIFTSPVVHTPQAGKAITQKYLEAALVVLNNATFRYLNEWAGPQSAVLEFTTIVQGIEINGVDIIGWNAGNRISSFKVMVRPLKAVNMLHQMMGAQLAGPEAGLASAPRASQ